MAALATLYDPLPNQTSIRVLSYLGSARVIANDIRCKLEIIDLTHEASQRIQYSALSYVWGDNRCIPMSITCNEVDTNVTPNLYSALHRIWSCWPDCAVWADAICIDQSDIPERSQQVTMMGSIFAAAADVVVWLGELEGDTRTVLDILSLSVKEPYSFEAEIRRLDPSDKSKRLNFPSIQKALQDLSHRTWFLRMCTFQEILLAKSAMVLIGEYAMRWSDFAEGCRSISKIWGNYDWDWLMQPFDLLEEARKAVNGTHASLLLTLLVKTQSRQATDPRDRVFALLGLLANRRYSGLQADYSVPLYLAFAFATRACIESDAVVDILEAAGLCYREDHKFPSWVPDLTKDTTLKILNGRNLTTYDGKVVGKTKSN